MNVIKRLVQDESGQGLAEYGLILALVAIVVIGALKLMGQGLDGIFEDVNSELGGAEGGS